MEIEFYIFIFFIYISHHRIMPTRILFMNDKGHLLDDIAINETNIDEAEKWVGNIRYL